MLSRFHRIATRGKVGVGESYTAGAWHSDDLVGLFELLLRNSAAAALRHRRVRRMLEARPRLNRRNGLPGARRNIAYHFDLGNELFGLMLDEEFYLAFCEAAFRTRALRDVQLTLTRPFNETLA